MYAGFNLNVSQSQGLTPYIDFSQYRTQGKTHLATQENAVRRNLSEFVLEGTSIPDGTAIQDDWFPEVDADIFISHSHKDIGLAEGLAGWLNETFGLRCFIDYNVWGYADNLLEEINSQYSNKRTDQFGGVIYDHLSCIAASKHVDTMLTMALYKMIDRCECVFLLNTGNSIQRYGDMPHDTTISPWIYSEIVCSQLIRKQPLSNYRKDMVLKHDEQRFEAMQESFTPAYKVTTKHLHPLNTSILLNWEKEYQRTRCQYPLDALYTQVPGIDADKLRVLLG